jgi:hypothetical protein
MVRSVMGFFQEGVRGNFQTYFQNPKSIDEKYFTKLPSFFWIAKYMIDFSTDPKIGYEEK